MASPILMGDSILKRLYARHAGLFDPLSATFSVSGQKVDALLALARINFKALKGRKVVVMIGTNDILSCTTQHQIKFSLRTLIRFLRRLQCDVHLCELLPIPRLGRLANASSAVININNFIRSFEPGGKIKIIRLFTLFCKGENTSCHLFEQFIGPARRIDLVHPNRDGIDVLLLSIEGV